VVGRPVLPAENGAMPHQTNLQRTKNWTPRSAGGVRSYKTQTREHLFKNSSRWQPQQKILWAEVRKGTDLFADERRTGRSWSSFASLMWDEG
jgi:hypothetical protein